MGNNSRVIHLYYHSPCFDGAASAAIASTYFQEQLAHDRTELHGVNYELKADWLDSQLSAPAAVLDFLYHPKADFWFDHHATTFVNDRALRDYEFRRGPERVYDRDATSCTLLIWRHWGAKLQEVPHFEPLVRWADRIDSARYDSVEEAVTLQAPALKINLALGTSDDPTFSQRLVRLFQRYSLAEVADVPEVRAAYESGWKLQQRGLERLKVSLHEGPEGIVMFDVDGNDVMVNRYAPFYLRPGARYSAGVIRRRETAKLTTMRNPWMEFPSAPLGEICAPLGGGGHRRVASIVLRDRDPREVLERLVNAVASWEEDSRAAKSQQTVPGV